MKPKLVFTVNSLTSGGAERVLVDLLFSLEGRLAPYDVRLVLLDEEPERHVAPAWARKHRLDARFSVLRSVASLVRLLRRLDPVGCVSFLTRANVASIVAARIAGAPCVISERVHTTGHLGRGPKAWAERALIRVTYPFADRVVAVSEAIGDDLAGRYGVARDRIAVIHNPMDVARMRRRALEPPAVPIGDDDTLAIGRLVPNKDFGTLVEAFARAGLPGRLVIIGEGPGRDDLLARAARAGIGERLVLPGYVDNPFPLLRKAKLFASSSLAEGFPNAIVEALAVGCPVVATDCPSGPREILLGGDESCRSVTRAACGILVPPGSAEALAQALRLAAEADIAHDLGERGRRRAEDFSVAASVDRYWSTIEGAIMASPRFSGAAAAVARG